MDVLSVSNFVFAEDTVVFDKKKIFNRLKCEKKIASSLIPAESPVVTASKAWLKDFLTVNVTKNTIN